VFGVLSCLKTEDQKGRNEDFSLHLQNKPKLGVVHATPFRPTGKRKMKSTDPRVTTSQISAAQCVCPRLGPQRASEAAMSPVPADGNRSTFR
jgi:hypothetical protein